MTGRILVSIALVGFLAVGWLLVTGHAGFAAKVTNYLFILLLVGVVYEIFKK